MKTISAHVSYLLEKKPFLQESLILGLINYSALATYIKPSIEKMLGKTVQTAAIQMALRRYKPPSQITASTHIIQALSQLGSVKLNSHLSVLTFKSSPTLIKTQSKFIEKIEHQEDLFYMFSYGATECTLIVSSKMLQFMPPELKMESIHNTTHQLSALSIKLPKNSAKIKGLYYFIFKEMAWNGINIFEVFSTSNEITILVEDEYVNDTFNALHLLKNKA